MTICPQRKRQLNRMAQKIISSASDLLEISPDLVSIRLMILELDYSEERILRAAIERHLELFEAWMQLKPSDSPGTIELLSVVPPTHVLDSRPLEEWSTLVSLSGR